MTNAKNATPDKGNKAKSEKPQLHTPPRQANDSGKTAPGNRSRDDAREDAPTTGVDMPGAQRPPADS